MTARLPYLYLGLLLGWLGYWLAGVFLPPFIAVILGLAIGGASMTGLRQHPVIQTLIALLDPIGIVLPILAVLQVLSEMAGLPSAFTTLELLVFLGAYTAFLASAMGYGPIDPYRFGYAPVPVAAIVLIACLYGIATDNWGLPLITVTGQAAWVLGWGSSNWFDHVLHALLVPVALLTLISRMI